MPEVERKGCAFHFVQAIWRHIQQLGMQGAYQTDDGTRKFMGLCHISIFQPVFGRLRRDASTNALNSPADYIQRIWIDNVLWSPVAWCVYRLSVSDGRPQMFRYLLLTLLYDGSIHGAHTSSTGVRK